MFAMFFDFESFLFRGREPKQRLEDMQRRFSRQSITKAKEIDDSSLTKSIKSDDTNKEEESAANNENEEVTEASSSHEKKDKQTFRDRKVNLIFFLLEQISIRFIIIIFVLLLN